MCLQTFLFNRSRERRRCILSKNGINRSITISFIKFHLVFIMEKIEVGQQICFIRVFIDRIIANDIQLLRLAVILDYTARKLVIF